MSILDFKQPQLCDDIWDENNFLRGNVRSYVLDSFKNYFNTCGIKGFDEFTYDIVIGSSLATYYYTESSDFDVKLVYDKDIFIKNNPSYTNIPDEYDSLSTYLIKSGRKSYYLTSLIPDTNHAIDCYFYSTEEYMPINMYKFDSLYSIGGNRWIQEPKDISSDFSPDFILEYAWDKASSYVNEVINDITGAKKSLIDLVCLRDYLKSLDKDDIDNMKDFFSRKFSEVNDAIGDLVKDKDDLKELRTEGFEKVDLSSDFEKLFGSFNYSDENLIFKIMQRYGYVTILREISDLYDNEGITLDNVDKYVNLVM